MEKVKRIRVESGISQKSLAQVLGMKPQNYSNLEAGRLVPKRIEQLKTDAIKFLKPHLVNKLLNAQSEVEKLESLLIQIK